MNHQGRQSKENWEFDEIRAQVGSRMNRQVHQLLICVGYQPKRSQFVVNSNAVPDSPFRFAHPNHRTPIPFVVLLQDYITRLSGYLYLADAGKRLPRYLLLYGAVVECQKWVQEKQVSSKMVVAVRHRSGCSMATTGMLGTRGVRVLHRILLRTLTSVWILVFGMPIWKSIPLCGRP